MDSDFTKKNETKYCCNLCDFNTSKKTDYNRHLSTVKHKNVVNDSKMVVNDSNFTPKNETMYACKCGRTYKYDSGYYRHIKKCTNSNPPITSELIMELIKDNKELIKDHKVMQQIILDQTSTINTLVHKSGANSSSSNDVNNINSMNNNKTFNLQFFLNETCKDAMNITDFVNNIQLELNDLENTGRVGYVEGVSNIIIKNLNNLENHMRPLHCSDFKREVLYIKHNNEWTKETDSKPILTKAIKTIANENIKQIKHWRDKHPDCTSADSKNNNLYLKIVSNSMNGLTKEEGDHNINKIISNIAKQTAIQK